jgi:hypothetical protein
VSFGEAYGFAATDDEQAIKRARLVYWGVARLPKLKTDTLDKAAALLRKGMKLLADDKMNRTRFIEHGCQPDPNLSGFENLFDKRPDTERWLDAKHAEIMRLADWAEAAHWQRPRGHPPVKRDLRAAYATLAAHWRQTQPAIQIEMFSGDVPKRGTAADWILGALRQVDPSRERLAPELKNLLKEPSFG